MDKIEKILFAFRGTTPDLFTVGLYNALIRMGFKVAVWNKNQSAAFDVFQTFEPNLFIDHVDNLDKATIKCVNLRPKMKVVCRLDNNSPDRAERSELLQQIKCLKITACEDGNKRKAVDSHLVRFGIDDLYFLRQSKEFTVKSGTHIYVGNFAEWKLSYLQNFLLPIGKHKCRIFGSTKWDGIPQYCGVINSQSLQKLYGETEFCHDITDDNQRYLGERLFQILASNRQPVTNNNYFPSFLDQYKVEGWERHTYFARAAEIFNLLSQESKS